jgi:cytochrome c
MTRSALTALALAALGAIAAAEEGGARLAYGRHLSSECTSCHRPDGEESAIPPIAGKPAAELIDLLRSYREGRKSNPVMVSVAKSLDEEQMAALAEYFAALPRHASDGESGR